MAEHYSIRKIEIVEMCYNCHAQMLMFMIEKEDYATLMALGGKRRETCLACSLIDIVWTSEWCGPVSVYCEKKQFSLKLKT